MDPALSPAAVFADHCRRGELAYQVAPDGTAVFPPRLAQPGTGAPLRWAVSAGRGAVHATTVVAPPRRAARERGARRPRRGLSHDEPRRRARAAGRADRPARDGALRRASCRCSWPRGGAARERRGRHRRRRRVGPRPGRPRPHAHRPHGAGLAARAGGLRARGGRRRRRVRGDDAAADGAAEPRPRSSACARATSTARRSAARRPWRTSPTRARRSARACATSP